MGLKELDITSAYTAVSLSLLQEHKLPDTHHVPYGTGTRPGKVLILYRLGRWDESTDQKKRANSCVPVRPYTSMLLDGVHMIPVRPDTLPAIGNS